MMGLFFARWSQAPCAGRPLRAYARTRPLVGITIHESVTTRIEPEDVLAKRNLGVHEVIHTTPDKPAHVTSHVPIEMACSHGGGWHNHSDVALEVESRYLPEGGDKAVSRLAPDLNLVDDVIEARWAWKRKGSMRRLYQIPRLDQLELLWQRIQVICEVYEIPLVFSGIDPKRGFRWGRYKHHKVPGIRAHANWHHADGLFPTCYAAIRDRGYGPEAAYTTTALLAQDSTRWTPLPERI